MAAAARVMRHARLIAGLLLAAACEPAKPPATRANLPSARESRGTTPAGGIPWDDTLGAIIATPSLDAAVPVAFLRDGADTGTRDVELFSHDDQTSRARLRPGTAIGTCTARRNAVLAANAGQPVPNDWSLALAPGVAAPVAIAGTTDLPPRDSAALVARISRLVSAIPEDSLSLPFHGLPVVVRDAWRFRLADGLTITAAVAMRSLNVESNPRAESVTLIAEPDSASGAGELRTAYWERQSGSEDRVEGADLLAALRLRDAHAAVALVREGEAGTQVEIVERESRGVWRLRWSTADLPCGRP